MLGSVLSQDFGRQMASCDKTVMSDSNALAWLQTFDGDRLILKWSVNKDRFAGLEALAAVTDWLRREGLPVSAPVRAVDGGCRSRVTVSASGSNKSCPATCWT